MSDHRSTNESVRHFIRNSLGCTCPDEVFDTIRISEHTDLFTLENTVYEIGGRLFVAVFTPADWKDIAVQLEQLVEAGKHYRDRHGYNRYRLVVVTDNPEAADKLQLQFKTLSNTDGKTHLHIIKPELLPCNDAA